MQEKKHGTVCIDVCEHGVWLDKGELFQLTEEARRTKANQWLNDLFRDREYPDDRRAEALLCPVSGQKMKREPYEGVTIDWSPGYGVWLDAGELEAILNNLRHEPSYLRGVALRLSDLKY